MSPDQWRDIALAYAELRPYNVAALDSFLTLAADEKRQYEVIRRYVRIEPWHASGQPYADSRAMRADVLQNRHLWVFPGGNRHPIRNSAQVFMGRAVHDIFAHALTGANFSPQGELIAYRAQAALCSPLALPALASDNIGQTAYYYFHPANEGKPHSARVWPEQKVDLLPQDVFDTGRAARTPAAQYSREGTCTILISPRRLAGVIFGRVPRASSQRGKRPDGRTASRSNTARLSPSSSATARSGRTPATAAGALTGKR